MSREHSDDDALDARSPSGPLAGIRVVEMAAIGPVPFAGALLSDLGADVVRIDRLADSQSTMSPRLNVHGRGRRSVALDLKTVLGVDVALTLCDRADVLLEGFRPGVMERLGLGPDVCLERNPDLVYGRMTGWGQDGPLADTAGHDIDYIGIAGALHLFGPPGAAPVPPANLVGDFGGGTMFLVFGVLAALLARANGHARGQVIDAAMVDGTALLTGGIHAMIAAGRWVEERGVNGLDGGAPWYTTYQTADGKYVAVGAIEPQFWAELLSRLGLATDPLFADREDRTAWPALRERLAAAFASQTRDHWERHFAGSDACVAPVLTPSEAAQHPHLRARGTFIDAGGMLQPAPAPRFSATPGRVDRLAPTPGQHTGEVLREWSVPDELIERVTGGRARGDAQPVN